MKRDFLTIADWSEKELLQILDLSKKMKANPQQYSKSLEGKSVALIFEKQSLRTHVTFEIGAKQLGANTVYLTNADISLGKRESIYDVAKNLERWVDAIVIRTFAQSNVEGLARFAKANIINALTDFEHPCQAVGDFLTIREHLGSFHGKKFVWIGDGNNVCHSLMLFAAKMGMHFTAITPAGMLPDAQVVSKAKEIAAANNTAIELSNAPADGICGADVVYTDVWVSMGQEADREKKTKAFSGFQVNVELMKKAKPTAVFMHCLPAHRGEEVTDEVIDSPQSIVFDEAENRLHTQKAILYTLLKGQGREKLNSGGRRRKLTHPRRSARNRSRTARKR
ncbi:MAG: ornithine carbamoyltransferase [Ignavibacteriae bacterium]|nr:MAG: ornithine carbamoyltransferase [Ignavibacteriota bacterium]